MLTSVCYGSSKLGVFGVSIGSNKTFVDGKLQLLKQDGFSVLDMPDLKWAMALKSQSGSELEFMTAVNELNVEYNIAISLMQGGVQDVNVSKIFLAILSNPLLAQKFARRVSFGFVFFSYGSDALISGIFANKAAMSIYYEIPEPTAKEIADKVGNLYPYVAFSLNGPVDDLYLGAITASGESVAVHVNDSFFNIKRVLRQE